MNLVIVESPTKAKTLARFLGADYKIVASFGHIRDLPKKRLAVDTDKNFKPEYVLVKGKSKQISEIKSQASKAKTIILATDLDREGEAIAYHVAHICESKEQREKSKKSIIQRIVFHEITKSAIEKAIKNPGSINMMLVDAQQARRVLDRLVGYKLSPLLWKKIRSGLSAGRVQSVAVRLIVDREREIEAFKPEEYWEIFAKVSKSAKDRSGNDQAGLERSSTSPACKKSRSRNGLEASFDAKLIKIDNKKAEVKNKKQADDILGNLKKTSYQVDKVEAKKLFKNPFPPFTTSTLQQQASIKSRFSAKRTMRAAQSLYEHGLITYHRTDSVNLAKEALFAVRKYIQLEYGDKYLPIKPRFYKTKSKLAQEAHEAIRPTGFKIKEQREKSKDLGRDQERLYDLIWKRTIASQMAAGEDEKTNIYVLAKNDKEYLLKAEGIRYVFDGWRKVYEYKATEVILPKISQGEKLNLLKAWGDQKFTAPPKRYSEAMLIKALEEKGIGRPSTYAPTISTIQDRIYVEKVEGRFQPTPIGEAVNDYLVKYFAKIMDYDFTAEMEDDLDKIAQGDKKWTQVIGDFYAPFEKDLIMAQEVSDRVKIKAEETGEKCPDCGGKLVIRFGRFGKFLACDSFPKCKYSAPFIEKAGIKCPECAGEVIIKKTKRGKRFYGCSNYPDCKFASWKKPKGEEKEVSKDRMDG